MQNIEIQALRDTVTELTVDRVNLLVTKHSLNAQLTEARQRIAELEAAVSPPDER